MAFLRKLIAVIGRGPTALVTAGVVGASVSAPHVVDSVGSGCLAVPDQVRSLVTNRWRDGDEKNVDIEGIWDGALEVDDGEMATAKGNYPCYLFLVTYGGVLYYENEETSDKKKPLIVQRDCLDFIWKKVWTGVRKGWKEFEQQVKSKSEKEESKKTIQKIIGLIEGAQEGKYEKIKEIMKEIGELWRKRKDDNSELQTDLTKIFYDLSNNGGIINEVYREVGDDFEKKVIKVVNIGSGNRNVGENEVMERLMKNSKNCAAT